MAKSPNADKPARSGTDEYVLSKQQGRELAGLLDSVKITDRSISLWFTYHQPTDEQIEHIKRIRDAGGAFAQIIKDNTLGSPDQSAAIRKVREATMTAIAGIVCGVK